MSLRDQLQAIRDEHGALDAALVVDTARDVGHPLHARFEWDDTVAGHRYRLHQAGQLLRVVRLPVDPARPRDLRAFVAVTRDDSRRGDYVPTEEAMADPFTRKLVLDQMRREWLLFKRRFDDMEEFSSMVLTDLLGEVS